jgi:hypothetical protein
MCRSGLLALPSWLLAAGRTAVNASRCAKPHENHKHQELLVFYEQLHEQPRVGVRQSYATAICSAQPITNAAVNVNILNRTSRCVAALCQWTGRMLGVMHWFGMASNLLNSDDSHQLGAHASCHA